MANITLELPDEISKKITELGRRTDEITAKALEAGAKAALPIFKKNLGEVVGKDTKYRSRSTGELEESLGVSPVKIDKDGNANIKLGFSDPRKPRYSKSGKKANKEPTNAQLANILENGKHGQPPKPFIKRTRQQIKKPFEQAVQKKFEEEVSKL